MLRKLTALCLLTLLGSGFISAPPAAADEAKVRQAAAVGADVPQFGAMAGRTAKGAVYLLGGLLAVLAAVKRFHRPLNSAANDVISVIARRGIGQRSSLLLVQIEGKKFFLSQSGEEVKLLAQLTPAFGSLTFDDLSETEKAAANL